MPGGDWFTFTGNNLTGPVPHELVPFTLIFPDTDCAENETTIELLLLLPETPVGNVQEYADAYGIGGTEYVSEF